jgi:hypothetical protein
MKNLEQLATEMVGDGQEPNLYFVSSEHRVEAVFVEKEKALKYFREESLHIVEDRLEGTVEVCPKLATEHNFYGADDTED